MRPITLAAAGLLLAGAAVDGHASPIATAREAPVSGPPVTYVQGWWERDHQEDRAREGYFHLPPQVRARYNQLQVEINRLTQQRRGIDDRIERAEREQKRLMGF